MQSYVPFVLVLTQPFLHDKSRVNRISANAQTKQYASRFQECCSGSADVASFPDASVSLPTHCSTQGTPQCVRPQLKVLPTVLSSIDGPGSRPPTTAPYLRHEPSVLLPLCCSMCRTRCTGRLESMCIVLQRMPSIFVSITSSRRRRKKTPVH